MNIFARARTLIAEGERVAIVRVATVKGSAPREVGAVMLVARAGILGSVGGGTLEWKALAEAQRLMSQGPSRQRTVYSLGPDLGQCCGGQVELETRIYDHSNVAELEQDNTRGRRLYLFGAGHVGKALVLVLAQTDFDIVWVDPRGGAFPAAVPGNVQLVADDDPARVLSKAPEQSLVLVMSHSHALDLAVVDASLRHAGIAATGLIGSATKRARFEKRLRAAGVAEAAISALICPIGIGGIGSKKPEAIAISTAAQLLALDERLKSVAASPMMDGFTQQVAG